MVGQRTTTLTARATPAPLPSAAKDARMEDAKALELVPVTSDGKEMTAMLASLCLAVFTEAAMAVHWLACAPTPLFTPGDCVTPLFVKTVFMDNALHQVYASAIPVGEATTAQPVFH